MSIGISHTPEDILWDLKRANASLKGKCFENCVIAVVGLPATLRLEYILGFVTPPGYKAIAHAWLCQETPEGTIYLDPTLQDTFPLWLQRKSEFIYDVRYRMTRAELLKWFRDNYSDRTFAESGIPDGLVRGPIINTDGKLV